MIKRKYCILYGIIFLGAALFLWHYLYISIGEIPLMDYWLNSGEYLEKIMTQPFQLNMVFEFPHALHWNPFQRVCDYFFVHIFRCDNRAYIYAGMIFSFASILYIMYIYIKYLSTNKILLDILGIVICILPLINLNQWEIFTLWCNFSFMFRIFMYFMMFFILDKILHNDVIKNYRFKVISYAIGNSFIILFVSQAYFPGLIVAEVGVIIVDYFIYRNRNKLFIYVSVLISNFSGFIIYYMTLEKTVETTKEGVNFLEMIGNYVCGICIMLGSTIVPHTIVADDINISCGIGIIFLILFIIAIVLFFKLTMYKKTFVPLMCMIYALISAGVITFGRSDIYGLATLVSSRYVVETTIGILGLVQVYWYYLCKGEIKIYYRLLVVPILANIIFLLCWTNKLELNIGPYRKVYNETMAELAKDVENVSDEELAIFQSPPEHVREGLRVMKRYHLLIWKE